ncbi:MAG: phosphoserine phosphatase RsbU/P [Chloroflexota bacterium]|nr:phosphoserine phosphatase RsbU/P [Chloroflexota bacterium]
MLAHLVSTHRAQITAVADVWLQSGARSFSVWANGKRLAAWPPAAAPDEPGLAAPVVVGDLSLGELRVAGLARPEHQARLTVDAALLSQWSQLESEIDGVANELIEAQDQLLALYDLTRSTRSHLSIPETLDSVAREAARLVKTEAAAALLWPAGAAPAVAQHPPAWADEAWLLRVFEQGRARGREVLLARDDANRADLPPGIDNIFLAPIQIGGKYAAALALLNKFDSAFGSPDMKLVRAIAEQAGAQIENVQLYQEKLAQTRLETEMSLARQVQMRLLPQNPPASAGLDVYARTLPALQVGGDFYDLTHATGGPYTFAVGDVSGKGISAALIMAMTRTVLRSAGRRAGPAAAWPTPAEIMSRATEELYDDLTEVSMFVTIFLGQYDPGQRRLCFANLGHSPVIYCPAGGPARLLEADGPMLGALPVNLSEDQGLPFGPDDLLIVATDGFNEARNTAGQMFGYERLLVLAEDLAGQCADEIAQNLYAAVGAFSAGHAQDDDQTLIILKGTPI